MVEEARKRLREKLDEVFGSDDAQFPSAASAPVFNFNGGTVFLGNGNVQNVYKLRPRITVVQTGVGVLDAQQKRRLLELRDQIVGVSRVIEGQEVTPATVMRKLNAHMKVNSYAEIPVQEFERAESYLTRWRGRLEGMPGATRSPGWRDRRIQAIHARCKELGCDRWRLNYMRKAFGKTSLIDLSNEEIGKLYRAVMDRKPEA